jgi:hypothetical protein
MSRSSADAPAPMTTTFLPLNCSKESIYRADPQHSEAQQNSDHQCVMADTAPKRGWG